MKLPPHEIKKIAVFRALQLGDMLCAIPAIRALRNAYPNAQITLLGLPWAKTLVERFSVYWDDFIYFPGFPGLPEQTVDPEAFTQFLANVQNQKFDLVLQMQGNGGITNAIAELCNGKHTAGFYAKGNRCPNPNLFVEYPSTLHETNRHLTLMNFLKIPSCGTEMEYPLYEKDYLDLQQTQLPIQPKEYICVHPGSRSVLRQWPTKYFAVVADYCAEQGLKVVLTGTKDEMPLANEVQQHMKHKAIIAAGKTSIGAVGALLKNAFLLISNCTGVSHIAAALQTPSVVISLDGEAYRWAPLNKKLHRDVDWTTTPDIEVVLHHLKNMLQEHLQVKPGITPL